MKKEPIILVGGGGHCKSCIDVIESEGRFNIVGIIDTKEKVGQRILAYEIITTDDDIEILSKQYQNFLITVGQIKSPELRISLYNLVKAFNTKLPVICSPIAKVSKYSKIGEGTIIMHHAFVNANSSIGKNCIINTKALIEHDVKVGNNCHISTNSVLNGGSKIGNNCFIGSNSNVIQNISIKSDTIIGASSLVTKNIKTKGLYYGNPVSKSSS